MNDGGAFEICLIRFHFKIIATGFFSLAQNWLTLAQHWVSPLIWNQSEILENTECIGNPVSKIKNTQGGNISVIICQTVNVKAGPSACAQLSSSCDEIVKRR